MIENFDSFKRETNRNFQLLFNKLDSFTNILQPSLAIPAGPLPRTIPEFPTDLISLANVTIKDGYSRWVVDRLAFVQVNRNDQAYSSWKILEENFNSMRTILNITDSITCMPDVLTNEEKLSFISTLEQHAIEYESRISKIMTKEHSGGSHRKRKPTNKISATVKRMRKHIKEKGLNE
jgi:hypothetical protein